MSDPLHLSRNDRDVFRLAMTNYLREMEELMTGSPIVTKAMEEPYSKARRVYKKYFGEWVSPHKIKVNVSEDSNHNE